MRKLIYLGLSILIITCLLISAGCASLKTNVPVNTSIPGNIINSYSSSGKSLIIPQTTVTQAPMTFGAGQSITTTTIYTGSPADISNNPDLQRMIVRTSNMTLVVTDIATTLDKINKLVQDTQGYVVSSNQWKDNGALLGTITIRVPAGLFDNTMSSLRAMADEVTSENTSAQDVTEEYTDLNAQLTNLEATQTQLLAIMNKAVTVEDILAVQQQLTSVNGQIDSIKGRMKYLEQTSATSLITISLTQSKLDVKLTASSGRDIRAGDNVGFYATISGGFAPYNYKWDFGDKSTSTDETPNHTYNSSGKFTVSLTVTDDKENTATDTRTDYITVQSGWNVGNVAGNAWKGLSKFCHVLVNVLVWIGIFSPVWLIAGGIAYWIIRRNKIKKLKVN
jgi:hypothetical protein